MGWFGRGGEIQPEAGESGEQASSTAEVAIEPSKLAKTASSIENFGNGIGRFAHQLSTSQLWLFRDMFAKFKRNGGRNFEDFHQAAEELHGEFENKIDDAIDGVDGLTADQELEQLNNSAKEVDKKLVDAILTRLKKGEALEPRDFDVLVNDLVDADLDSAMAKMSLSPHGFKNVQHMLNTLGVESVHHEDVVAVQQESEDAKGLQAKIDKLPAFWQRQARSALRSGVVSVGVGALLITVFGLPLLPVLGGAAASYSGANIGRGIADAAYRERNLRGTKEGEESLAYKVAQDKVANIVTMREFGKKYQETVNVNERAELAKQIFDRMKFNESANLKQYKSLSKKARLMEMGAGILGGGMVGGILAQAWHSMAVSHEVARETKERTVAKLAEWAEKGVRVDDGQLVVGENLKHLGHVLKKTADDAWRFIIEQKDITAAMDKLGEHWQQWMHGNVDGGSFDLADAPVVPADMQGAETFHISSWNNMVNSVASEQVAIEMATQNAENVLTPLITAGATSGAMALEHGLRPEFGADGQPLGRMTKEDRHSLRALSATAGTMKRQADSTTAHGTNGAGGGGGGGGSAGGDGSESDVTIINPSTHVITPDSTVVSGDTDVISPKTTVIRSGTSVVGSDTDETPAGRTDALDAEDETTSTRKTDSTDEETKEELKTVEIRPQMAHEIGRNENAVQFNVSNVERGSTILLKIERSMQVPSADGSVGEWSYINLPSLIINGDECITRLENDTPERRANSSRARQIETAFRENSNLDAQYVAIQVFPAKLDDNDLWGYDLLSSDKTNAILAELRVENSITHDEHSTTMGDREKYAENDQRKWRRRVKSSNMQKREDQSQQKKNGGTIDVERDYIERTNRRNTLEEVPNVKVENEIHKGDVISVPLDEVRIRMRMQRANEEDDMDDVIDGKKRVYSFQRFTLEDTSGKRVKVICLQAIEDSEQFQETLRYVIEHPEINHLNMEIETEDYDKNDDGEMILRSYHIGSVSLDQPIKGDKPAKPVLTKMPSLPIPDVPTEPAEPTSPSKPTIPTEPTDPVLTSEQKSDEMQRITQLLFAYREAGEKWLREFDNPNDINSRLTAEGLVKRADFEQVFNRWIAGEMLRELVENDLDTNLQQVRQAIADAIHSVDFKPLDYITQHSIISEISDYPIIMKNYYQFNQSLHKIADGIVNKYIKDGPPAPQTSGIESIILPDDAEQPISEQEREEGQIRDIRFALAKYQNIGREWLGNLDADEAENPRFNMFGLADDEHQREIQYRLMVGGMLFEAVEKALDPNKVPVVITSVASKVQVFKQFNLLKRIFRASSVFETVNKDYKQLQKWVKKIADGIIEFNTEPTLPEPPTEPPASPIAAEVEALSASPTTAEPPAPDVEGKKMADNLVAAIWEQKPKLGDISDLSIEEQFLTCAYNRKHSGELLPGNGHSEDMKREARIALDADGQSGEARFDAITKIEELQEKAYLGSAKMWEQAASSAESADRGVVTSKVAQPTVEAPAAVEPERVKIDTRKLVKEPEGTEI